MLKCTYVDGLENGEESRFYANGRLSSKKCYASGLLVGAHQVFDIDGNLVASGSIGKEFDGLVHFGSRKISARPLSCPIRAWGNGYFTR